MSRLNNDYFQPEDLFSIVGGKKNRKRSTDRKIEQGTGRGGKGFSLPHHYSASHILTYGLLGQMLTARSKALNQVDEVDLQDTYALKKIAGTFIEGIGLTSVTYSPLWRLSIMSEGIDGNGMYFDLLVKGLKGHGLLSVVEQPETIDALVDCLNARSKVNNSQQSALLAHHEMNQLKVDIVRASKVSQQEVMMQKMDRVWVEMNQLVNYERIPFEKLIGIMTLDLVEKLSAEKHHVSKYSIATMYEKYHSNIMTSYSHSINKVSEVGRGISLMNHMTPFVQYYKQ